MRAPLAAPEVARRSMPIVQEPVVVPTEATEARPAAEVEGTDLMSTGATNGSKSYAARSHQGERHRWASAIGALKSERTRK